MKKQVLSPRPSIAGYVSHIVVLEYENRHVDLVLPLITNGYPSIVFQSVCGAIGDRTVGYLSVYGQNRQPFPLVLTESFVLIACFLHPWYLQPMFGVSARELTDVCIDLEGLQPVGQRGVKEQLLDATTLEQRLALMEQLVLQLAAGRQPMEEVCAAVRAIRESKGLCSMAALQTELRVSERTLQRVFESGVGLTPRMYGRICQFDAAFQQLNTGRYSRLSDIAYRQG